MSDPFTSSPIPAALVFVVLFVSDALLTIRGARLYHAGAYRLITLEGSYELNPRFAKEVDRFRALSPRFLAMLAVYALSICGLWYFSVRLSWLPQAYPLFVGAILLPQGPVHLRHIRNIAAFNHALGHDGIDGAIHYSRRFSYRMSAIELTSFAMFFLLMAALSGSTLLLGGSLGAALIALNSYFGWKKLGMAS